jgi:hypothetical protein
MTGTMVQLPRELELLIDSRLDTIDRMLVGRMSRPDRLAIVREVESQIYDLLQEGDQEEYSRESVLAVLARLDPPEAYLPDATTSEPARGGVSISPRARTAAPPHERNTQAGRVSGALGLVSLFLLVLSPVPYGLGMLLQSEIVMLFGWGAEILAIFTMSIMAIALAVYARFKGSWAIIGVVASGLSILATLTAAAVLIALIVG